MFVHGEVVFHTPHIWIGTYCLN